MDYKLIIVLAIIAIALYCSTQTTLAKGKVAKPGENTIFGNNYENVSAAKHDFYKIMTINLLSLVFFSSMPIISSRNFFDSVVGRSFAMAMFFMAYHAIVQPHIANHTSLW